MNCYCQRLSVPIGKNTFGIPASEMFSVAHNLECNYSPSAMGKQWDRLDSSALVRQLV